MSGYPEIEAVFDFDEFLSMWAVDAAIQHWDAYSFTIMCQCRSRPTLFVIPSPLGNFTGVQVRNTGSPVRLAIEARRLSSSWKELTARSAVLALCDGVHALTEIEAQVRDRFGDLFASPQLASAFVREVIAQGTL